MRIFVCCRLHHCDRFGFESNLNFTKDCCRQVSNYGFYPYSPALFCTQFLNEMVPGERERGLMIGLRFLEMCRELWVFQREGDTEISHGMRLEIDHARKVSVPVYKVEFKDQTVFKTEFKG
jgi:hypothetical protein